MFPYIKHIDFEQSEIELTVPVNYLSLEQINELVYKKSVLNKAVVLGSFDTFDKSCLCTHFAIQDKTFFTALKISYGHYLSCLENIEDIEYEIV